MNSNSVGLTRNKILNGTVTLYQPKQGFRIGIDSVLLASSVNKYSKCIEFGTGSGIILVYLSKKFPDSKILGIEKNIDLVNLAKKNLKENNINQNCAEVVQNDLDNNFFLKKYNNGYDRVINHHTFSDKVLV